MYNVAKNNGLISLQEINFDDEYQISLPNLKTRIKRMCYFSMCKNEK